MTAMIAVLLTALLPGVQERPVGVTAAQATMLIDFARSVTRAGGGMAELPSPSAALLDEFRLNVEKILATRNARLSEPLILLATKAPTDRGIVDSALKSSNRDERATAEILQLIRKNSGPGTSGLPFPICLFTGCR